MSLSCNLHVCEESNVAMVCENGVSRDQPPYVVLRVAGVTIFANHEQIKRLRGVLNAWIGDNLAPDAQDFPTEADYDMAARASEPMPVGERPF